VRIASPLTSVKRCALSIDAAGRNIARDIMNRSSRRLVAWLGILGIVLAQFAATAHACAVGSGALHDLLPAAIAGGPVPGAVAGDTCAGHMTGAVVPAANVCEVHCSDGATPVAVLDLPAVALAPLPVPAIPLAALAADAMPAWVRIAALSAGPPIVLQFGHLLI